MCSSINSPCFFFFRKLKFRQVELLPESHTSTKWPSSGLKPALPSPHRADVSGTAAVDKGARDNPSEIGENRLTEEGGGRAE